MRTASILTVEPVYLAQPITAPCPDCCSGKGVRLHEIDFQKLAGGVTEGERATQLRRCSKFLQAARQVARTASLWPSHHCGQASSVVTFDAVANPDPQHLVPTLDHLLRSLPRRGVHLFGRGRRRRDQDRFSPPASRISQRITAGGPRFHVPCRA